MLKTAYIMGESMSSFILTAYFAFPSPETSVEGPTGWTLDHQLGAIRLETLPLVTRDSIFWLYCFGSIYAGAIFPRFPQTVLAMLHQAAFKEKVEEKGAPPIHRTRITRRTYSSHHQSPATYDHHPSPGEKLAIVADGYR